MKCISLWQPWASWMAWGVKQIETRSWGTSYRGPLLIHAAKTKKGIEEFESDDALVSIWKRYAARPDDLHFAAIPGYNILPLGAIVGVVDLVDCQRTEILLPTTRETEQLLGNYEPGRFGWVTRNTREFIQPIPYRGMQGLFDVPDEVVREAIANAFPCSTLTCAKCQKLFTPNDSTGSEISLCQDCWENHASDMWWEEVKDLEPTGEPDEYRRVKP